ncbi:hypothetical protein CJD38_02660 [Stenotrophobium rhamnosiphilum]|uniref:Uncharacterized protein n=1 Tax=Stenotrophobium rhamnosiphilum TaxID=2029166 RepID=A0A2T5MKE5_9GAMM|nr:hypothetical protein CJD38_02660 [Stenotrophobium rhamnosiphilum]
MAALPKNLSALMAVQMKNPPKPEGFQCLVGAIGLEPTTPTMSKSEDPQGDIVDERPATVRVF